MDLDRLARALGESLYVLTHHDRDLTEEEQFALEIKRVVKAIGYGITVDPEDEEVLRDYTIHSGKGTQSPFIYLDGASYTLRQLIHSRATGRLLRTYTGKDSVARINDDVMDHRKRNMYPFTGAEITHRIRAVREETEDTNVSWHQQYEKWQVAVRVAGTTRFFGRYEDQNLARHVARGVRRYAWGVLEHRPHTEEELAHMRLLRDQLVEDYFKN